MDFLSTKHVVNGCVYSTHCKQMAESSKSEQEKIYYLTESHMPGSWRQLLRVGELKNEALADIKFNCETTDVFRTQCKREYTAENWQSLRNLYRALPKEWVVVQISKAAKSPTNFTDVLNHKNWDNDADDIYVTRFECGDDAEKPFVIKIPAPKYPTSNDPINLHEIVNQIIVHVKQKNGNWLKSFAPGVIKDILYSMDSYWISYWKALFFGHIQNTEIQHIIEKKFRKFASLNKRLTIRTKNVLRQALANLCFMSCTNIAKLLKCLGLTRIEREAYESLYQNLNQEYNLRVEKRYPVILIVDDELDKFPWEAINDMVDFEYTRVSSLRFLSFLYFENRSSISNGYYILNKIDGGAIINPDNTLINAEYRLTSFLTCCLPDWTIMVGKEPTSNEFIAMLAKSNVFAYCGHSNGMKYIRLNSLIGSKIPAIVFLMGCSSVELDNMGHMDESFSVHDCYHMASTPCVIGSLWPLVDVNADIFFTDLLTMCFVPKSKFNWLSNVRFAWKEYAYNRVVRDDVPFMRQESICQAVSYAKIRQEKNLYSCAFVCRGLPTLVSVDLDD